MCSQLLVGPSSCAAAGTGQVPPPLMYECRHIPEVGPGLRFPGSRPQTPRIVPLPGSVRVRQISPLQIPDLLQGGPAIQHVPQYGHLGPRPRPSLHAATARSHLGPCPSSRMRAATAHSVRCPHPSPSTCVATARSHLGPHPSPSIHAATACSHLGPRPRPSMCAAPARPAKSPAKILIHPNLNAALLPASIRLLDSAVVRQNAYLAGLVNALLVTLRAQRTSTAWNTWPVLSAPASVPRRNSAVSTPKQPIGTSSDALSSSATTTASISIGTLASSATADDISNASEVLSVPSGYDFCSVVQGTASDTQDGNPIVSVTCNSGTTLPGHVSATVVPPPASLGSTPAQVPGKTVSGGARCHGDGHRRRKECSHPSVLAVSGLVTPTALDETANSLRVYSKSSLPTCGPALRTSIGLSPPMQSEMALSISATATSPTSSTTIPSLSVTCGTMATSTPASNLPLSKGSTNPIDFVPINDRSVSASGGHCKKKERSMVED